MLRGLPRNQKSVSYKCLVGLPRGSLLNAKEERLMLKRMFLLKLIVFCNLLSEINAQDQQEVCELFCRVVSAESGFPVYYTTVKLSGTNKGVIADHEGQFRLPCNLVDSDKIILSSIGYKTKKLDIKELQTDKINVVYLEPHLESLEAVTLTSKKKRERKLPARLIVLRAIKNIPLNYPKLPYSYIGYYRDYQQPIGDSYTRITKQHQKDAQYINLNESIIEVFDAGFETDYFENESNQALLYSYDQNKTFIQDKALAIPYDNKKKKYLNNVDIFPFGGNEFSILKIINAIRNHNRHSFSFANVFNKNFERNHFFSLQRITSLDDQPIYEIDFVTDASVSGENHFAKGSIFISKKNFAIHKLHYELHKINEKTSIYEVTIEYVPIKNKMYLNYITFNNKFKSNSDHYFKVKEINFDPKGMFFDVFFNNELDENTIHPVHRKFKVTNTDKKHKVKIERALVLKDRLRIFVDKQQLRSLPNFSFKNLSEMMKLDINNVKDTNGKVLNRIPRFVLNQYREMFVQEVFPEKEINKNLQFMDKNIPLSESVINSFVDKHKYWVNTPLKQGKVTQ